MSQRIVCFDLGGVVIRICRSWQEGCAEAGLDVRDPQRLADPGLRARRRQLRDLYQAGAIDCAAYWDGVSAATDGLYSPQEVRRVHLAWTIEDYPGVADLIARLNAREDIVTACLSNTNHAHWVLLRDTACSPAIGHIRRPFASHEMGTIKPDQRIYRQFEVSIGATPDQIVFFDDLAPNVEAARARGWDARQIDHTGDTASQIATALTDRGVLD